MTRTEALLAYADAVQALVDALPPEAATPEVLDALKELGKATHQVARAYGPLQVVQ